MNRIVTEEEQKTEQAHDKDTVKFTAKVKRLADFDFNINREQLIRQGPFMAYICLLVILFIYNSHRSEKIIRETDRLTREVKDLRSEYISALSELMGESKQSTVAQKLAPFGIKELKNPPSKITYSGK
ncbi:MAG: hypothetical protein H7296_10725 [Bacteroidia bacterium]|nr:hypothetical protein [Bacteroidia bacterium]